MLGRVTDKILTPWFGRNWHTPIAKHMWPFMISASIVYATIWKIESSAQNKPPYDTDPRNPRAIANMKHKEGHH
ncbi:2586_t:CDS:2 [Ambispora leptoticha]|uniref:2586_t:CDS:1 n=1 Tax=Ambispora leptoticha TaxID=144679 RepID=A0A9N9BSM2_9GLOM|nr:2586_t:CDS:2 [Ambispora leptoticha]